MGAFKSRSVERMGNSAPLLALFAYKLKTNIMMQLSFRAEEKKYLHCMISNKQMLLFSFQNKLGHYSYGPTT